MENRSLQEEIQDLNLAYLLLAQRMLGVDRDEGMFRLKIDAETADLLEQLNARQLTRLARTNQLLCHLGLNSARQIRQLTEDPREQGLTSLHAALLMAESPDSTTSDGQHE